MCISIYSVFTTLYLVVVEGARVKGFPNAEQASLNLYGQQYGVD